MSLKKTTQYSLNLKRDTASHLRARIKRLDSKAKLKGSPAWEAQKQETEIFIGGVERNVFSSLGQIGGDPASEFAQLKYLAGQRHASQAFISEVEDAQDHIEDTRATLKRIEEEIKAEEAELEALKASA